MNDKNQKLSRRLTGTVTSSKMDKTVVVAVDRVLRHKIYDKQYTVTKKYKAHDEKNQYLPGNVVVIEACRPLSKDKTWRVVSKLK